MQIKFTVTELTNFVENSCRSKQTSKAVQKLSLVFEGDFKNSGHSETPNLVHANFGQKKSWTNKISEFCEKFTYKNTIMCDI